MDLKDQYTEAIRVPVTDEDKAKIEYAAREAGGKIEAAAIAYEWGKLDGAAGR